MAVALGTFDGLHIGHGMLIQQLKLIQAATGCSTMVYTFLNNPLDFLCPEKAPPQIMTLAEKTEGFNSFNMDFLVLSPFDRQLASMSPRAFIEDMLVKRYNIRYIVVGYDFKFGSSGSGDIELLRDFAMEYDFELVVIPPLSLGREVISSSLIRRLIMEGHMEKVSMYLGRPYSIDGKVVHGFGRGKDLGFPTANLEFPQEKVIPKYGIYLTRAKTEGAYHWGMTNVGINPTFNKEGLFIETHLLDYSGDLYGAEFKVEFLKHIRDEIEFNDVESLKGQIDRDIQWAKNYVYKFR